MPMQTCAGAALKCSFGISPSELVVLPVNRVVAPTPAANIMDHIPLVNILPFGMCSAPANPGVIAATAAAMGVPTPVPCIPATATPWVPGAETVIIAEAPALDDTSKLFCMWAGVITILDPGQEKMTLP